MAVAVKQWAKFDVLVLWNVFLLNIQIFPLIMWVEANAYPTTGVCIIVDTPLPQKSSHFKKTNCDNGQK